MDYKRHFTDSELDELLGWFEKHADELPQSLTIDNGSTYIKDLKRTVGLYHDIVNGHRDNPTYSGQIYTLEKIRLALLKSTTETEA